jgi:hypothetical protein
MKKLLAFLFLFGLQICSAQVSVVLAPPPKLQFFTQTGQPLAFGCVFTYQSQTTTPLTTYTDFTGTTANDNPVPLNAGGFAGGGSSGIWLQAGQAYTLKVVSQGGINCASGTLQYTIDGIGNGGSTLTTVVASTTTPTFVIQAQAQMFQMTLTGDTAANPLSAVGIVTPSFVIFQLTQDAIGNHQWTWPANVNGGSPIGLAANQITTQMFVWNGSVATAVGPANIQNGSSFSFAPGYLVIPNANPTGTTLNTLTKLINAPSQATIAGITDTGGVQGICVAQCTNANSALIQTGGNANCVFDGATAAGDYIGISTTVAGNCHDVGSTPVNGQSIGRVLVTNVSGGVQPISLFGPEIQTAANQIVIPNNGSTGTTLNTLTWMNGNVAQIVPTSFNGIIQGITVRGAGTTGNATIQQGGIVNCVFDGSTVAGDAVQASATIAGNCNDPQTSYTVKYHPIGTVLSTNVGAGTYQIILDPPPIINAAPITAGVAGTGAGTGPTVAFAASSYDAAGQIQLTTGTAPATNQVILTVTYPSFPVPTWCTLTPGNSQAALDIAKVFVTPPLILTSSASSALAGSTLYIWNYTCNHYR